MLVYQRVHIAGINFHRFRCPGHTKMFASKTLRNWKVLPAILGCHSQGTKNHLGSTLVKDLGVLYPYYESSQVNASKEYTMYTQENNDKLGLHCSGSPALCHILCHKSGVVSPVAVFVLAGPMSPNQKQYLSHAQGVGKISSLSCATLGRRFQHTAGDIYIYIPSGYLT